MKLHRFIIDINLEQPSAFVVDPEIVGQWRNVLRFKVGDQVMLCDGQGYEAVGTIETLDKAGAKLRLDKPVQINREPGREIILYCALLKRENFETVAQKAVEVGASRIVPIITERTIKKDVRLDRLQKIMKEAAEQSGRGVVPALHQTLVFEHALVDAKVYETGLFFDASGPQLEADMVKGKNSVAIFIGPEGGWRAKELQLAEKSGLLIVSLGPLTLRAETAAIVASYLLSRH